MISLVFLLFSSPQSRLRSYGISAYIIRKPLYTVKFPDYFSGKLKKFMTRFVILTISRFCGFRQEKIDTGKRAFAFLANSADGAVTQLTSRTEE